MIPRVLIALAAFVALADTAAAAVRSCKPPVASGLASARTETDARRAALSSWVSQAKTHGAGYASWRLAAQKTLKCVKAPQGGFDCVAVGQPCIIQQAPGRPKKPLRDAPISI